MHGANGVWVLCSADSGLYYSIDGKTWLASNIKSGGFRRAFYANGIWVATGTVDNGIYYSLNGQTWSTGNIKSGDFYCVHNANGLWVVGGRNTGLYYSTDGKSWSPAICNYEFVQVNGIFGSSGIYIAAAIGGDRTGNKTGASYSIDGKTWYMIPLKDNAYAYAMYAANGMWVAATSSGLYYSPTWEAPPVKIVEEWVLKSTVATGMTTDGESKTHETEFISGPDNATFDALRIYTIFDGEIT